MKKILFITTAITLLLLIITTYLPSPIAQSALAQSAPPPSSPQTTNSTINTYPLAVHVDNLSLYPTDSGNTPAYPTSASFEYPANPPIYTTVYTANYPANIPGLTVGTANEQVHQTYIYNPSAPAPGFFAPLTWDGCGSSNCFNNSITPPGNAHIYSSVFEPGDTTLDVGSWVTYVPVSPHSFVDDWPYFVTSQELMRLPIVDEVAILGPYSHFQIVAFGHFRLRGYDLNNMATWFLFELVTVEGLCTSPSAIPATLSATPQNNDLALSWTTNNNNTLYQLHRSPDPYFTPLTTTLQLTSTGTITTYLDTDALTNSYYYRLQTENCDASSSALSNPLGHTIYPLISGQ
ncbi:MAG TPA: hypothetical protein VLL52_03480 [Anaerolineae bacterium]|nr:hypothetical protein [Anaerolineae bacterium]